MASRAGKTGSLDSDKAATRRKTKAAGYVVADGTQVHHDGRVYEAGETLDAPDAAAEQWLARGYVTEEG